MRNRSVASDVRWKTMVVESVAVVASILLAFGIDAYWELRQERLAEREAMDALYIEMSSNRDELAATIQRNNEAAEHFVRFLTLTPDALLEEQFDYDKIDALWAPYTFDPDVGVLALFLDRGTTVSDTAREVRRAAVNWQTQLSDAGEESNVMWETSREVLGLMTKHLTDIVPPGGAEPSLYSIEADYGQRLSLIRADEDLLAAAKTKFTLQGIYKHELRLLLEKTDLLLELLDPQAN